MRGKKITPSGMVVAEPDQYNKIVYSSELMDIKMIESNFSVLPIFFSSEEHGKPVYACEFGQVAMSKERLVGIGTFSMEAGCKVKNRWILRLKAKYMIAYQINPNIDDGNFKAFLERVGAVACYPYFRSYFASTCSEAGADMPPLPIFKIPPIRKAPEVGDASSAGDHE